jgi:hypothetical protein
MKTITKSIVMITLLICLLVASAPSKVSAIVEPPKYSPPSGIANGSWEWNDSSVPGHEVDINLSSTPNSPWLQLLSKGIVLSGATEICHPFQGGQFGWTGVIYELKGETWQKLTTTNKWVPDEEGQFMSCANAQEAGTYALFGYFIQPEKEKKCKIYWLTNLNANETGDGGLLIYGTIFPVQGNVKVSYKFTNVAPAGSVWGATSASTFTDVDGNFAFTDPVYINYEIVTSFHQRFYINGCELSVRPS